MKFFEVVPSGTRFGFIKNRWRFILFSIFSVLAAIGTMGYNQVQTGSILNFGIDFAGGTQVRLAFDPDREIEVDQVREALTELDYEGSSVVTVPDADHELLIRVKDVLSIAEDQLGACEEAAGSIGGVEMLNFTHPKGGSKLFIKYSAEPNYREVERALNAAGCDGTADKGFGKEDEFPVEFSLIGIGSKIKDQLNGALGEGAVIEIVLSESVGPKVGKQLKRDGVVSMLYAIGFIFLFVMIRFDLRFAPGGIVALSHDALLVVGAFAVTGKEFTLQTVAAVLTIIGYSINDTIVVFDRVRERVAMHRDEPIEETTNSALNETLSRTVLTSVTTLVVVIATYLLGSGPIKDFAFALIVGLIVGTYSSLFIATPVFLWVNKRFYQGKGHLKWLEGQEREGTGTLLAAGRDEIDESGKTVGEMRDAEKAAEDAEAAARPKASRRRRRRRSPGSEPKDDE